MEDTFVRRGCPISMERWLKERIVPIGVSVVLEDWIEFKNQDKKVVLRIAFNLWEQLKPEVRDALVTALRDFYG